MSAGDFLYPSVVFGRSGSQYQMRLFLNAVVMMLIARRLADVLMPDQVCFGPCEPG